MFEDTLLIIKSDYLYKRKMLLLKLLDSGFQIQASRRLLFSPEHAAEFYNELAEDRCFMLQVILLSKGVSEAFILSKQDAVQDLVSLMVCYFGTSVEMERNVHISLNFDNVAREIGYIFPNYISEPIGCVQKQTFCKNPLFSPMFDEIYGIVQDNDVNVTWKLKLAEWLQLSNKTIPRVSNQCNIKPRIGLEEKAAQTRTDPKQTLKDTYDGDSVSRQASSSFAPSSVGSSGRITSSSCITCSCFDGGETCLDPPPVPKADSCLELISKKAQELDKKSIQLETPAAAVQCEEEEKDESVVEEVEWIDEEDADGEEQAFGEIEIKSNPDEPPNAAPPV